MNKNKLIQGSADKRKNNSRSNSTYDGSLAFEPTELFDGLADVDNVKEVMAEKERLEEELDELKQEAEEVKQEIAAIQERGIVPRGDGKVQLKRLVVSTTGVEFIPEDLTEEEWSEAINAMRDLANVSQWTIGDLVNHAELVWKHTYEQMAAVTPYVVKTLREYAYVARNVDVSRRMDTLSFGHHHLIASKDNDEQKYWLNRAVENGWSVAEFRQALADDKAANRTKKQPPKVEFQLLFSKDKIPKIDASLQENWIKARNGNEKAKAKVMKKVEQYRQWLDDLVKEMGE